ncbi:serine hydrolase [Kordiimonas sediminis]|uniref:Serine hydrolase n=1 Tax=Kordiimonas sediminis TaxID=1735581 RepID=A0A919E683_9PROT|nr:serine hydrolase domain-containing protein [Kordiimonas sediminis]GHF23371.1 serine hydrolase [Kordiimonas sediminis]
MKILKSRLVCTLLSVLVTATVASAQSQQDLKKFDRLFSIKLREGDVPGGAYVIVKEGEILQLGTLGYRKATEHSKVNKDTAFRLASVSKTFAATLAAKLVEEGTLSFEEKVAPYAPELRLRSSASLKALNIRHLLSHTSGLMPNAYDNILEAGRPVEEILPRFNKVRALCQPGDCYGYQNIMFSLVEPVIKEKTGADYGDLIEERLFKPLEMNTASVGFAPFLDAKNVAAPHQRTRKGVKPVQVKEDYYRIAPAAGVNASIVDLSKWLIAHTGHRPDVISPEVLKTLTAKQIESKRQMGKKLWRPHLTDAHYGLGWRLYQFHDEEIVAHGGAVAGFRSMVAYSADRDVGLAILINTNSNIIDELTISFFDDVFTSPLPRTVVAASR